MNKWIWITEEEFVNQCMAGYDRGRSDTETCFLKYRCFLMFVTPVIGIVIGIVLGEKL